MSVTELISIGALTLTVIGFIIKQLSSHNMRIRDLEKELASETARSIAEDSHHSEVINEIKSDIKSINTKLDSIIKAIGGN